MNNNTKDQYGRTAISEDVKIHEFDEGENSRSDVRLKVPFRINLCGIRPLSEYKRIALEDIRIKISTVFGMMEYLGEEIRTGEFDNKGLLTVNEFSLLLGVFGKGLAETLEIVENSFDRYERNSAARRT